MKASLFFAVTLLAACGSSDRKTCQSRNDRLAAFESKAHQFCGLDTSFQSGGATVTACEKTVAKDCNSTDLTHADAFLSCIEPLDDDLETNNGNACNDLPGRYQTCYGQHADQVRPTCLTLLFGVKS